MSTLRDFIAGRKAEVDLQMKGLRKELAEIAVVERALESAPSSADEDTPKEEASKPARAGGKTNLREMALEVLRSAPNGMATGAIQDAIALRYGIEVAGESLSSQLSRLGAEKALTNDGFAWSLASESGDGSKAETPAESPDAVVDQPVSSAV